MGENNSIRLTFDAAVSCRLLWAIASKNDVLTCCHRPNGEEQWQALWMVAGAWGRGEEEEEAKMVETSHVRESWACCSAFLRFRLMAAECLVHAAHVSWAQWPQRSPRRIGSFLYHQGKDRLVIQGQSVRSASRAAPLTFVLYHSPAKPGGDFLSRHKYMLSILWTVATGVLY